MVPIEHQMRPLLSGLATTFHRLSSTAFYYVTLSMPPRSFGSALAPGSQMAPSGHTAAQCRHARARACLLLWAPARVSGAQGGYGRLPRCPRHRAAQDRASPQRLYLAAAMTRALPAAVESAQYIRLRTSVLPWLQPGRWGAAPHWVSAAFYHLSTILRVRGRISNPLVLHPTPPLIASERACLKPLHPDCMGCMSSR